MGGSIVIRAGETRGKRIQSAGTGDPVGGGALGAKEEEGARERQSAPPVVGVPEGSGRISDGVKNDQNFKCSLEPREHSPKIF